MTKRVGCKCRPYVSCNCDQRAKWTFEGQRFEGSESWTENSKGDGKISHWLPMQVVELVGEINHLPFSGLSVGFTCLFWNCSRKSVDRPPRTANNFLYQTNNFPEFGKYTADRFVEVRKKKNKKKKLTLNNFISTSAKKIAEVCIEVCECYGIQAISYNKKDHRLPVWFCLCEAPTSLRLACTQACVHIQRITSGYWLPGLAQ